MYLQRQHLQDEVKDFMCNEVFLRAGAARGIMTAVADKSATVTLTTAVASDGQAPNFLTLTQESFPVIMRQVLSCEGEFMQGWSPPFVAVYTAARANVAGSTLTLPPEMYRRSGLVISREQGLRYDAGFAVPVLMS